MAPSIPTYGSSASGTTSGASESEAPRSADSSSSYRTDHSATYGEAGQQQDWWSRLSHTLIDLLRPLSAQLFEKLDDALFDRSGSSSPQFFFDSMRILRKNRDVLTQSWFDRLADGWNHLRPQAPGAFRPRLVSTDGVAVDANAGLALVDEMTLERSLAVDSAVSRGASLCRMELPPLQHRLTLLRKGALVEADDIPAAPRALAQAFAQSLDDIPGLPVEVALVVFKLFDRVVITAVGAICQELNRVLAQGGVAPHWVWSAPARPANYRPMPPPTPAAATTAPMRPAAGWEEQMWLETVPARDTTVAEQFVDPVHRGGVPRDLAYALQDFQPGVAVEQSRLTASVRALLEHRRLARHAASHPHASAAANPAIPAGNPLAGPGWTAPVQAPTPQTLELETLMEVLASLPPPALPASWVGDVEEERWDPDRIKHELRSTLDSRLRESAANAPADEPAAKPKDIALGAHEDVIDMVALMFTFIQQDQALPAAVQALLSRLQLPYLRLALVDGDMFADANHPARVLMDRLAEVGKACTPGSPMLAERMLRMHALVGRIVKNHSVTRAFLDAELTQFRLWSDSLEQRAAERERAQVAPLVSAELPAEGGQASANAQADLSAEQRAHLHQIRLAVVARMRERLEGRVMPEGLRHALSLLWVNHQVRVWEMHGEKSYEASWLDRQLDAVVGLISAKPDARAQADLEQDWPGIERAWSAVLAEGPAAEEARAHWIDTFRRWADIRTGRAEADPAQRWNWLEGLVASRPQPEVLDAPASAETVAPGEEAEANSAVSAAESPAASTFKIKPIPPKPTPARWKVGDWIEFKAAAEEDAGAAEQKPARAGRGKVSWIGSFTGRTILVKPDGTLWREENRVDLDDLLDRGLAFVVARESLFDRSLNSMFRELRNSVVPEDVT